MLLEEEETAKGGSYDDEKGEEGLGFNAIINLCLALRQWVEWRKQKEGFKPRPSYAARILSNGSRPKSGLIRQENGFREHSARIA